MIETTTRIDIKQYEKYIDKQVKTKTNSTKKRRFMRNLIKFDVIEKKKITNQVVLLLRK